MSLFAELRRRNVIRMAGLYLVGAWLAVQVAGTLLPVFGAPPWAMKALVSLLIAGFFAALLFSWVFELTPDGLKRDAEVPTEHSIAPQTARRMDRAIIAVLILALGYFAFDKLVLAPRREAALVAQTTQKVTTAAAKAAKPVVGAKSIAVLPFVNMSGDAANEYFSDGISEEILNVLARTAGLQVAARTSSFSFKGKDEEIPEIARKLQVRMVLEGSVRKQDDRVRITAQLIDATNGFHVWSQTYDRKLADIFAIQDEIARAIGDELQVRIAGTQEPGATSAGTRNLEAYDLYLRGIALWQQRRGDTLLQAIDLFEQATAADPEFAQAYAGAALVYAVIANFTARVSFAEGYLKTTDFAQRALVLDPLLPEPYAALGLVAADELRRQTSDALFRRAIALRPSFATAYQWRGMGLMIIGDPAGGLASLEHASTLDPRSLIVAENHAVLLTSLGRYEDARARCNRALELEPGFTSCMADIALAELLLGNLPAARSMLERLAAAENPSAAAQGRELTEALAGRGDKRQLAERYAAFHSSSNLDPTSGNALYSYQLPAVIVLLGGQDLALDQLERFLSEPGSSVAWAVVMPALDPIRCEPRFKAVVERVKVKDPHAARVCAAAP